MISIIRGAELFFIKNFSCFKIYQLKQLTTHACLKKDISLRYLWQKKIITFNFIVEFPRKFFALTCIDSILRLFPGQSLLVRDCYY